MENIIFESDYAKIVHRTDLKLISIIWQGSLTHEQYSSAFTKALDYQKDSKIRVVNYMSDIRKQSVVAPESRQWFQEVAVPRAKEQGLLRGAVVFSGGVFKKYYLNHISKTVKNFDILLRFFSSCDEAYGWFRSFS